MGSGDKQATFSINLEGNLKDQAVSSSDAMRKLQAQIQGSEDAVKAMSGALRRLRGSTDEVKAAKDQLRAKIEAERQSISRSSLAMLKAGTSSDRINASTKQLTQSSGALQEKMGGLSKFIGEAGTAAGAMTIAATAMAAAVVAVTVAVVAGAVAIGKWIVESANQVRTASLVREAFTGNASDAAGLGQAIDALSGKVSTSKDKLQGLALELRRTRLSGTAIIDTLNLVGQASDAMGDDVGNALKEIVTRGQIAKRFQLNPQELIGKGVDFQGVAGELAKNLNVGVKDAQLALFQGRVKLEDGAKALRQAVEKRFGAINARKMLDLNVQAEKFKEKLVALTSGVNLEPLLRGFDALTRNFDKGTVNGYILKDLITKTGNAISKTFEGGTPIIGAFFDGIIIGTFAGAIAFIKLRNAITKSFGPDTAEQINGTKLALELGAKAAGAVASTIMGVYVAFRIMKAELSGSLAIIEMIAFGFDRLVKNIKGIDWKELGLSVVKGIAEGLAAGPEMLGKSAIDLANAITGKFTNKLQIHSPSKVFEKYGEQTTQGYAQGLGKGAGGASGGTDGMIPGLPSGAGGASGGMTLEVHFHAEAGATSGAVDALKKAMPSFMADLVREIEAMNSVQGAGAGAR